MSRQNQNKSSAQKIPDNESASVEEQAVVFNIQALEESFRQLNYDENRIAIADMIVTLA